MSSSQEPIQNQEQELENVPKQPEVTQVTSPSTIQAFHDSSSSSFKTKKDWDQKF
jgi:hypothetical protein